MLDDKRDEEKNAKPTSSRIPCLLIVLAAVACGLLVLGGIAGGVVVALGAEDDDQNNIGVDDDIDIDDNEDNDDNDNDDNDDEIDPEDNDDVNNAGDDVVVNFNNTEFNLFEFFAICIELADSAVKGAFQATDPDFVGNTGISTCFGGSRVTCDVASDEQILSAFHCPTSFNGTCLCDQGSINLDQETRLDCDINLGIDEQATLETIFNDTDQCVLNDFLFDNQDVLSEANVAALTQDVEGDLNIFNAFLESCVSTQSSIDLSAESTEDAFQGCINENLLFLCSDPGYQITFEPCAFPPGDEVAAGDNIAEDNAAGGDVVVDFDDTEFNLFEFFALCDALVDRDDLFVQDFNAVTDSGISTCFGGSKVSCDPGFGRSTLNANHCPTSFNGLCLCDQGSISINRPTRLDCDINLGPDEQESFENSFDDPDNCVLADNVFDVEEVFAGTNISAFTDDVQRDLDIFNSLVESCVSTQVPIDFSNGPLDDAFQSCINENFSFFCGSSGYDIQFEPCLTPPGEEVEID